MPAWRPAGGSPSRREDRRYGRARRAERALGDRVEHRLDSVGELEMTRRISPVAVCCSRASVSARSEASTSAIDPRSPTGGTGREGLPHSSQNFACGRFSCWHRGHRIPSVSRVRIVSGQPGTRRGTRAAAGARLPGRSVGHGRPDPTPTRPRAPDGRFWGVVRPGACGETPWAAPTSQNSRLRHAPDGYAPSWRPDPASLEAPLEPAEGDLVSDRSAHRENAARRSYRA